MNSISRSVLTLCLAVLPTTICLAEKTDDKRHPTGRKEKPSSKEVELEREWIAVDKTSSAELQAYLDKKPRRPRIKEATELLPIAKKLEAILSGAEKPGVVIPYEAYGKQRNIAVEKLRTGAVSYDKSWRSGKEVRACWTYRSVEFDDKSGFTKGVFADSTYAAWPRLSSAGPGSILAFDSGGDQCPSERLPVIVTGRNEIVYLGVVDGVGYVHLGGKGQVVYPDGKAVPLQ